MAATAALADYSMSSDFLPHQQPRDRSGSMSFAGPPNPGENGGSPAPGDGSAPTSATGTGPGFDQPSTSPIAASAPLGPPPGSSHDVPQHVQDVLQSEIGISTMLNRLKQSIASVKEFSGFLRKRAQLEDEHSNGLRKVAKMTAETMSRQDHIQGSFGSAYSEMMSIHERMADNGHQFGLSLHQMQEELVELATVAERNRKIYKQSGLAAEQRVADLENAMRKSKAKYDQLADDYDRARTGDTSGRRGFGFKGPKSGAQLEESLLGKVQAADADYHHRVQTLQAERGELERTTRPETIKTLRDLVRECDGGLALQVQKFASYSEKLLLSNGISVSPIKSQQKPDSRSLRDIVAGINSENDLNDHLGAFHSKVPPQTGEPRYERHPVLGMQPNSQMPMHGSNPNPTGFSAPNASQPASMNARIGPTTGFPDSLQQQPAPSGGASPMGHTFGSPVVGPMGSPGGPHQIPPAQRATSGQQAHERSFSHGSPLAQTAFGQQQQQQQQQFPVRNSAQGMPNSRFNNSPSAQGPPQLGALSFQDQPAPGTSPSQMTNPLMQHPPTQRPGSSGFGSQNQPSPSMAPAPSRPVFGVSLSRLYERDALAVPMVVYQCIQAVDHFGLNVEGIYRLSGSVPHVNKLKGMFDTDSSSPNLDFRNPENFFHDVNSVAGLLKQFFRDLPDPVFPSEHYAGVIEAAQAQDDIVRRDSLHAIINSLPDPNYATLRALTLHLSRVIDACGTNRMTAQNLAIVFGPTLLGGTNIGSNIADAGWQVKVIDTILQNTYQIFDED